MNADNSVVIAGGESVDAGGRGYGGGGVNGDGKTK